MNKIVGFATIDKNATTGTSAIDIDKFRGKDVRVIEFAQDGGVLVIDNENTGLAMFDKKDVYRRFECSVHGPYICPPKLNMFDIFTYTAKCAARKGGYTPILAGMVIQAGLMKGEFNDSFLWAKEKEEHAKNTG